MLPGAKTQETEQKQSWDGAGNMLHSRISWWGHPAEAPALFLCCASLGAAHVEPVLLAGQCEGTDLGPCRSTPELLEARGGQERGRASRAWSCWSRIPKLETEQGFGLCWRCCSRVSIPNPGHLRRGKAAAEGVKQLPLSWIQPCKVKPSQAGPRNCSWLWQGKGHPQCIPKAAAPMGCAPSVWNSTCGMCWKHLEEPLPGAVCSQGL